VIKVAIFASGNGSNAINIFNYFKNHPLILVDKIYCNNLNAGIIEKSQKLGIECIIFTKQDWISGHFSDQLVNNKIDFIILAGFLWLVPIDIILTYKDRIINIHPALLPSYGGKGMYGVKVHEKVIADQQLESGITIHIVNEEYDKGKILHQQKIKLEEMETADSLALKIHSLEYSYFPKTIENYIILYNNKGH